MHDLGCRRAQDLMDSLKYSLCYRIGSTGRIQQAAWEGEHGAMRRISLSWQEIVILEAICAQGLQWDG